MDNSQHTAMAQRLNAELRGEFHTDIFTRGRYATDASIYQIIPMGVVIPQTIEEIATTIEIAREHNVSITARGGGTSQNGQTVNAGIIIDNSRHLNQILELDLDNQRCRVQSGLVLDELNRVLKPHGLWFPVDVSTASRATIGGMTANNSCGQRSIHYGTMRHNVHAVNAILSNGENIRLESVTDSLQGLDGPERNLAQNLLSIGARYTDEINIRFPNVLRRVGGYNVDALIPPEKDTKPLYKLSDVLVGSEGTLAYSTSIDLKLSPLPKNRVLGICHFPSFYQAMDATQHLVELGPHAVELVDNTMISLARDIDIYKSTIQEFVRGEPAALLIVEFAFETQDKNLSALKNLHECMADLGFSWQGSAQHWGGVVEAVDTAFQARIAEVRKAGLNIMMSMKSEGKPVSFVEDCAVELSDLAEYTAQLNEIFARHNTEGTWYAHASVGCLHVRPVLNMKLEKGAKAMRAIAEEAFDLVLKYKGSHSGEHGDGISRSEFHDKMFGPQLVQCFNEVKQLFDPHNLFNPGKIVNPHRMDDRSLFRYQPDYKMIDIQPRLDWSSWTGTNGGFQGAIEMCNNNGACRKLQGGAMCPSYRVTRNERDVTRGRANALRLALSGQLGNDALVSKDMMESMKLCVSCKACKRECPTGVDMAKMKIELQAQWAKNFGHSLHHKLVAHLPKYAPYVSRIGFLANLRNKSRIAARLTEPVTGFTASRALPSWSTSPFIKQPQTIDSERDVVLLADTFNRWFEPENLSAAVNVLHAAGFRVNILDATSPQKLCCGRTYLATGMLEQARTVAQSTINALLPWAKQGIPIVGLEPSCLLTLRDEYLSLIPGKQTQCIAKHAYLLEELLQHEHQHGRLNWQFKPAAKMALVHGHCHQKAFDLMPSIIQTLALIPNMEAKVIESSCCGMAGAFGYHTDTVDVSLKMAELDLLPAVRAADGDTLIIADGTSCRHQIESGSNRKAMHVARVLDNALEKH